MLARKDGIVGKMTKGIEFLFKKNKIDLAARATASSPARPMALSRRGRR
jgi:pyruvate/2-oxoglutarate dehydrogenase complex dihydrolipoamide dehydrogenase (E3) component